MVSIRALLVNTILGLIVLVVATAVGPAVEISIVTLLICAILGSPGAILAILLALLGVAFVATVVPAALVALL
jgi:hypothetical protein